METRQCEAEVNGQVIRFQIPSTDPRSCEDIQNDEKFINAMALMKEWYNG